MCFVFFCVSRVIAGAHMLHSNYSSTQRTAAFVHILDLVFLQVSASFKHEYFSYYSFAQINAAFLKKKQHFLES